jgi:hypothetical protein
VKANCDRARCTASRPGGIVQDIAKDIGATVACGLLRGNYHAGCDGGIGQCRRFEVPVWIAARP